MFQEFAADLRTKDAGRIKTESKNGEEKKKGKKIQMNGRPWQNNGKTKAPAGEAEDPLKELSHAVRLPVYVTYTIKRG